jgi:CBS domain-containing protein
MELHGAAQQVWIFIGESDSWHGQSLSLAILETLKRNGCAGGTVLKGVAGFGAHSFIHTSSLVELSGDLPLVITFVDRADRVARVLPELMAMVNEGLITTLPVEVLKYTHRVIGPFPRHLTVQDVMSRNVARVHPDTPIHEVVTLLLDRALRSVPVVDDREQVIGIITDGDLLSRGATLLPVAVQRELPLAERAAQIARLANRPQTAADIMTRAPVTLVATTPLAQAALLMNDRHLKRLPVVDGQGQLVGVVSRYDLLKTVAEGLRQRPDDRPALPPNARTAGEVMLRGVPIVHRDTPLAEALDRLLEDPRRRVLVVDDAERVVGIITDADVLGRAAKRVRPNALRALAAWFGGGQRPAGLEVEGKGRTAADIMTSPLVTVAPETPLTDVIRLMIAHRIKRIPVVDMLGRSLGMVGRAGVLAALSQGSAAPDSP